MRILVVALAVVMGAGRLLHADPAAEQLFRDGQALMKQGKLAEACDRFARSQKLEARSGTLLNLAVCREELGMTATAWELFMEAKALSVTEGKTQRADEANRRAAALKPKLAYLTIQVPEDRVVGGFELRRNGLLVASPVWNVAVPIDPGDVTLVASAPGHESWSATRTIAQGQRATIVVEALVKSAATTAVTTTATGGASPTTAVTTTDATLPHDPASSIGTHTIAPASTRPGRWGIGVHVGESTPLFWNETDVNPGFGVRVIRGHALSKGALRAVGSVLYATFNDDNSNGSFRSDQLLVGAGLHYAAFTDHLVFSAGVNAGLDLLFRNENRGTDAGAWFGADISPLAVHLLDGQLEAGLHVQAIQSKDRLAVFGLAIVDWYIR